MKLGMIGTGKIVHEALHAMEPLPGIERKAIYARPHSRSKGEALAKQYAISEVYTDYDALLDAADVDTVYIGLVNSAHYEYAKRALEKGKHVILEKPFTGTLAEAENLYRLAKEKELFLFEAITVLHTEVMEKMRSDLPKLGRIRMMQANYSQYSSRYDRYLAGDVDPSFDPAYQSGALRDINVYNVHYAAALFGQPNHTRYFPNSGYNGIDTSGTLVLEYDGFSAVCTGAKDSDSPCFVCIQGERGYMRIDGKPNVAPNLTTVLVDDSTKELVRDSAGAMVRATLTDTLIPKAIHHRMTQEFREFGRMIDEKDAAAGETLSKETLVVMRIIEEASQGSSIPG